MIVVGIARMRLLFLNGARFQMLAHHRERKGLAILSRIVTPTFDAPEKNMIDTTDTVCYVGLNNRGE